MRKQLKKLLGVRGKFTGKVERFGTKETRWEIYETLLLVDVKNDAGKIIADHVWLTIGKRISSAQLEEGDIVSFKARVTGYEKGYKGRNLEVIGKPIETDYRLSCPTKIKK